MAKCEEYKLDSCKSGRIHYLDTAKGIGIILVCMGHACTNQSSAAECQMADLIRFVTLFHMALFFFINGMLYQTKYSEKPVLGSIKKLRSYYIPFVKYNLLFWFLHNFFAKLHLISGKLDAKDYAYEGLRAYIVSFLKTIAGFRQRFAGAMWFLEALIIISIVFIFVDYAVTKLFPKKRSMALTVTVLGIVLMNRLLNLSEVPHVPGSLTQMVYWGLNGLLFFYLGYLYKLYSWNEKLLKHKVWLVPVLFLIVILAVVVMKPRIVSVITNVSIPVYQSVSGAFVGVEGITGLPLLQYFVYAAVCLCGIVMMILLSQFRKIERLQTLKMLGRYSLHIMCLHLLAFKCVSLVIVLMYHMPVERLAEYPVVNGVDGFWWLAYTICGCVLPVLVVRIYEIAKNKIVFLRRK